MQMRGRPQCERRILFRVVGTPGITGVDHSDSVSMVVCVMNIPPLGWVEYR
jgi:hypothetical protein